MAYYDYTVSLVIVTPETHHDRLKANTPLLTTIGTGLLKSKIYVFFTAFTFKNRCFYVLFFIQIKRSVIGYKAYSDTISLLFALYFSNHILFTVAGYGYHARN